MQPNLRLAAAVLLLVVVYSDWCKAGDKEDTIVMDNHNIVMKDHKKSKGDTIVMKGESGGCHCHHKKEVKHIPIYIHHHKKEVHHDHHWGHWDHGWGHHEHGWGHHKEAEKRKLQIGEKMAKRDDIAEYSSSGGGGGGGNCQEGNCAEGDDGEEDYDDGNK